LNFNPKNILVIDFGQLGDVVLSLPALKAIRERFANSRITVAVGKPCAQIIELSGYANEKIVVDRVQLRDSAKLWSVMQIGRLALDVRRREFDFVIDLHSLPETNILGFLSGAAKRLYARRENRSLDFLANFTPRPPREDKAMQATDRYLDVLRPLGIKNAPRTVRLKPSENDAQFAKKLWQKYNLGTELTVGLFPGAGHPSRRWSLEKFAELADYLERNEQVAVTVFLGPEERDLAPQIRRTFPPKTIVFDDLSLTQLIAVQSHLSLFVSNDTGPMHLAAAVGTSVVLLMEKDAPQTYTPLISNIEVVRSGRINEITVEDVYIAAQKLLRSGRIVQLFDYK
jgi:ADP-heptose:LPS heptosyltransferase